MVEADRAARRLGQRDRVGGRRDLRLILEQFAQPLGGAGGAQQIAIDFAQRAERAGDEHAGRDERQQRARRDDARRHRAQRRPHSKREPAEQQADHHRRSSARGSGCGAWPRRTRDRPRRRTARPRAVPARMPGRPSSPTASRPPSRRYRRCGPGWTANGRARGGRAARSAGRRPECRSSACRPSRRDRNRIEATPPMPVSRLRSATDTVVPTAISICAVSAVSREAISDGRFSSNQPGSSRSRLRCTATRTSATVRSPSQDTK